MSISSTHISTHLRSCKIPSTTTITATTATTITTITAITNTTTITITITITTATITKRDTTPAVPKKSPSLLKRMQQRKWDLGSACPLLQTLQILQLVMVPLAMVG